MKEIAAAPAVKVRRKSLGRRILEHWQIYLLLLPAVVYFIIFYYGHDARRMEEAGGQGRDAQGGDARRRLIRAKEREPGPGFRGAGSLFPWRDRLHSTAQRSMQLSQSPFSCTRKP